MKFLRLFFCIVILFLSGNSFSQNSNNVWYFGNYAGLDFNSGSPVALISGQLNTQEGCSSISDNSGNLLFYTDGMKVWNRNHIVMPNGTGLMGNSSTTQSALIVPAPGSSLLYYLFAIDDLGGAMTYSIVDMSLASGLGDVTLTKNVLLHPNVSEKQSAVLKCDGNIWVISHESNTNTFFADLITTTGISPSILSSVGTSHAGGGGGGTYNTVGQMKISQQGNRIALALRDSGVFEVFDFDINTGVISNPISINPGAYSVAYGVEFSPDGSKLYGGRILASNIYQFNLLAGSPAAISASATVVGSTGNFTNSFQLGTDGKIYIAKSISQTSGIGSLDVINNPNLLGVACSYSSSAVSLGGKLSLLGLPNFMVRPPSLSVNVSISGTTTICSGQSTTLVASGGSTYSWSGGIIASSDSITVSPLASTTYYLNSSNACGSDYDTIIVQVDSPVNIVASSSNDSICSGQISNLMASGSSTYQWSGGASSALSNITVNPLTTSTYYVSGDSNACGMDSDTLTIFVENLPIINVSGTLSICSGQSTTLTASGGINYNWSGGSITANTDTIVVNPLISTSYFASSANICGNDTDTVNVQVETPIDVIVSVSQDSICEGQTVNLGAVGSSTYQWSGDTISSLSNISVNPLLTTIYYISGDSNACGMDIDTVPIFVENIPNINISGVSLICSGQSTILTASGGGGYIWSGAISATTPFITVNPLVSSTYYVTSSSLNCGSDTDTIIVDVDTLVNINVFSSNDTICSGQTVNLSATGSSIYQWMGGSSATSDSISVSPTITTNYFVSGSVNSCGSDTDTLIIVVMDSPILNITGITGLCTGQSTTIVASGATTYQWSGGSIATSPSIFVSPTVFTEYFVTGYNGACYSVDSVTITVDTIPVINVLGNNTICENDRLILSVYGADSYSWSGGITSSASSITVVPLVNTIYTVVGINGGCVSPVTSFSVTVNPKPIASINGPTLICTGVTVNYLSSVTNGSAPYNYLWSTNDSVSIISLAPVNTNTVLNVIVTDAQGCADTSDLMVQIVPNPITSISSGFSGCVPLNVNFNVSSDAVSYLWDFGDGNTSSLQYPSNVYNIDGSYNITLVTTNSNGCSDTLIANSYINAYSSPLAGISSSGNVSSENPVLMLSDSSQLGSDCVLYFGDGSFMNGCNWGTTTHEYESEGDYTVIQIVTNSNGCSDTAEIVVNVNFESTFFAPNAFTPNGNGNNDMFSIYAIGLTNFNLIIFDRWGEKVFESNDIAKGWDGMYKGNLVPQGVYVWKADYTLKKGGKRQSIGHVTVVN